MEYIYSAMLLHKAGQEVNEGNVKKVLESVGVKVDETRVKALVAALEGVNIDEAIEKAAVPVAVAAAPIAEAEGAKGESKAEEKKNEAADDKKSEEQAAAGLGSLFG